MEVRVFSAAPLITKDPRQGIFCYVDGGEDYAVKGRKADGHQFVQCLRGRDAMTEFVNDKVP